MNQSEAQLPVSDTAIIQQINEKQLLEKDEQIRQLTSKLGNVTAKYNNFVYNIIDNKNLMKLLSETLYEEQQKVEKLIKENEIFRSKVISLRALASDLSKGLQDIQDLNNSNDVQPKMEAQEREISSLKGQVRELEALKRSNKVLKDLVQQQQSSRALATQVVAKEASSFTRINPIPENSKLSLDTQAENTYNNLRSSKNNTKFKHHRKSRSFGFGDKVNFNFPFKAQNQLSSPISATFFKSHKTHCNDTDVSSHDSQLLKASTFSEAIKKLDSPENICHKFLKPNSSTSLDKQNTNMSSLSESDSDYSSSSLNLQSSPKSSATSISEHSGLEMNAKSTDQSKLSILTETEALTGRSFFRELQRPLSPLKINFFGSGLKKKSSSSSLRITTTGNETLANNSESPITQSKMNKLFGATNISLVNMSRPVRNGAHSAGKSRVVDCEKSVVLSESETYDSNFVAAELITSISNPQAKASKDSENVDDIEESLPQEELESFTAEICDATKLDYTSLDPKYVITPKIKQDGGFSESESGSKSSKSSNENLRLLHNKKPSLRSIADNQTGNVLNYMSPKKRAQHVDNEFGLSLHNNSSESLNNMKNASNFRQQEAKMHSNEQRSKNSFGSPAGKNVCMNDNNGSNNTKVFHGFRSEVMGNKFSTDAPFSEPIRPMNSNSSIGSNYQNYNNNRSNTNLYAKASNNSIQSILTHENKSCGDNKFKKPFLGLDKPENFCKRPRANSNSGLRRFF